MTSLALFTSGAVFYLKRKIEEVEEKGQRKKI
jgi:hypothetical protein